MACNPAPAAQALLRDCDQRWPTRSHASDGICASAQHSKNNPNSDHETGNAVDVTHDPKSGCDGHAIVTGIVSRADKRVKYLIFNRTFYRAPLFAPVPYVPSPNIPYDPHTTHVHVSIYADQRNDSTPWLGGVPIPLAGSGSGSGIGIGDAAGIAADAAGSAVADAVPGLGTLVDFVSFVTDPANWLRVAGFVTGIVLVALAFALWLKDTQIGETLTDAAGNAATIAAVA